MVVRDRMFVAVVFVSALIFCFGYGVFCVVVEGVTFGGGVVLFFTLKALFHPIFLPGPISCNKPDGKGNCGLNSINDGREMPGQ
ncbi:hypothetical protein [Methanolobus sp. WCC5]|uniref:hypothetical protein n=1 Tax=Methanolobus sp. WCC5 TaxID=3125785 RepID=UPI003246372D